MNQKYIITKVICIKCLQVLSVPKSVLRLDKSIEYIKYDTT